MATYADQLANNVRARRVRRGLDQELLAARMRALGFSHWVRQTVARVEGKKRRLTAEEVFGLGLALETRITALIEPDPDDGPVGLPSGEELPYELAHALIWGGSEHTVTWHGDVPTFPVEVPPPGWTLDLEETPPPPRRKKRPPQESGDDQ